MKKFAIVSGLAASLLANGGPAAAQDWPWWARDVFSVPGDNRYRDRRQSPNLPEFYPPEPRFRYDERQPDLGGDIRDGGPRPEIEAKAPPIIEFRQPYAPNTIVIDSSGKRLYYVLPNARAYVYRISVGREGFNWTGTEVISRKQAWPDWHPPAEMRERDPRLPIKMIGGLKNPLGALALYLGNTLYRIHGTNDPRTIGQAASSGCFRMLNAEVLHLASIADIGTRVTVVPSLPGPALVSEQVDRLENRRINERSVRAPAHSGRPPSYRVPRQQWPDPDW
ncbi:MAG: L,D-transpeptidase [Hyphomicrobiaceae bacterium]|nr:MAG: L,D-transpeptidase [Hyphomicrobiaceae bacterium]